MIKSLDEDVVPKGDRIRILNEIAVEKGFDDHANFRETIAKRRGYLGWNELSAAVQRKLRVEKDKYDVRSLSPSMRRLYYFFYNAGRVSRNRLNQVIFRAQETSY